MHDIYVVQEINLATNQPLLGYFVRPSRPMKTMLEFQKDANVGVRIPNLDH